MEDGGEAPKIHIDSDWKAQAQAEKARLAAQSKPKAADGGGRAAGGPGVSPVGGGAAAGGHETPESRGQSADPREMPPANFETLLSTFITQALFAMGAIPDPETGQPVMHLDLARHHIDMLGVLEEKTKGNLSDDESKMLSGALYELRSGYVEVARASRGAGAGDQGPVSGS